MGLGQVMEGGFLLGGGVIKLGVYVDFDTIAPMNFPTNLLLCLNFYHFVTTETILR